MPKPPHEAMHRIFQDDRTLFVRAFRELGVEFPEPTKVSVADSDLTS